VDICDVKVDICDALLYLCDECNNYTIKFQLFTEKVERYSIFVTLHHFVKA